MSEEKKTTKKAGRPANRKGPKTTDIISGIVNKPDSDDNRMEYNCNTPSMIKGIVSFFKALDTQTIQFIFKPEGITVYGIDHFEVTKIQAKIDCTKSVHYYCSGQFNAGFDLKEISNICDTMDDQTVRFCMFSSIRSENNIKIIISDSRKTDEIHTLTQNNIVKSYSDTIEHDFNRDEEYSFNMTLDYKHFNAIISKIYLMQGGDNAIFAKTNKKDEPLTIKYTSKSRKVSSIMMLNSESLRINQKPLMANIEVNIKIAYIRPIAGFKLCQENTIYLDEKLPLMTKINIESTVIKTLTTSKTS